MDRDPTGGRGDTLWRGWRSDPVWATWALWGVLLVMLLVTYTRVAPADLYHTSIDGFAGGLSRVIVQINFPIALVAIAAVLISLDRLSSRWRWWAAASIVLCAVTAWPGVVDDGDLDVRWVNAVPALGVVMALVITVAAARTDRSRPAALPLDRVRWVLAGVAAALSIPWIAADLGVYLPGRVFIMEEALADDRAGEIAVHLGHHHGFDGALMVVSALLLSRVRLGGRWLAPTTQAYVALLFAYGAVNMVQDDWNEQLVKRGWVDWWMPSALHPALTAIWAVVVVIAAVVWGVFRWETPHRDAIVDGPPSETSTNPSRA
jgi:hypothetical protein